MNGIGPNFNPNMNNLPQVGPTDRNNAVGEPQEATAADNRPEGETEVNKTIQIIHHRNGKTTLLYDGKDNGQIEVYEQGNLVATRYDAEAHSKLRDNINENGNGNSWTY